MRVYTARLILVFVTSGVPSVVVLWAFFTTGSAHWALWVLWAFACLFSYLSLETGARTDAQMRRD